LQRCELGAQIWLVERLLKNVALLPEYHFLDKGAEFDIDPLIVVAPHDNFEHDRRLTIMLATRVSNIVCRITIRIVLLDPLLLQFLGALSEVINIEYLSFLLLFKVVKVVTGVQFVLWDGYTDHQLDQPVVYLFTHEGNRQNGVEHAIPKR